MILYAITLKNMSRDANGLPNYVWATESQIQTLGKMRNNVEKRYEFVQIGNFIFSPMDISHIEKKDTEYYGGYIPKYAKNRYLLDQNQNKTGNLNNNMPLSLN